MIILCVASPLWVRINLRVRLLYWLTASDTENIIYELWTTTRLFLRDIKCFESSTSSLANILWIGCCCCCVPSGLKRTCEGRGEIKIKSANFTLCPPIDDDQSVHAKTDGWNGKGWGWGAQHKSLCFKLRYSLGGRWPVVCDAGKEENASPTWFISQCFCFDYTNARSRSHEPQRRRDDCVCYDRGT